VRTVAIIRKPLDGTVVNNVLTHGCGGLNIDESRIKTTDSTFRTQKPQNNGGSMNDGEWKGGVTGSEKGRWPANLILNHLEGCRQDGIKRVKGIGGGASSGDNAFGQDAGWNAHQNRPTNITRQMDKDGKETVANWVCETGCPVRALDEQSGVSRSAVRVGGVGENLDPTKEGWRFKRAEGGYTDNGGATRFFKSIQSDLVSYLRDLITPPEGEVAVIPLDMVGPEGKDESLHGVIALGTPTEAQCVELLRICKPGAHVLLIAPEEQATGHTGMCRMEDAGFEIRDTILLLLEDGGFWYIPKPSRTEREAGCAELRGDGNRGNSHPTVKPYAIMEALLEGVPKDAPTVDPFMGSGTTGIAALHTGHDFIGIEREEGYLKIAEARIRHWDQAEWRGHTAEIQSDIEQQADDEGMDLSDLFGMGG